MPLQASSKATAKKSEDVEMKDAGEPSSSKVVDVASQVGKLTGDAFPLQSLKYVLIS